MTKLNWRCIEFQEKKYNEIIVIPISKIYLSQDLNKDYWVCSLESQCKWQIHKETCSEIIQCFNSFFKDNK